jgi:hypothetical protein
MIENHRKSGYISWIIKSPTPWEYLQREKHHSDSTDSKSITGSFTMFNPHKNINLSIETAAKTHVLFYSVGC